MKALKYFISLWVRVLFSSRRLTTLHSLHYTQAVPDLSICRVHFFDFYFPCLKHQHTKTLHSPYCPHHTTLHYTALHCTTSQLMTGWDQESCLKVCFTPASHNHERCSTPQILMYVRQLTYDESVDVTHLPGQCKISVPCRQWYYISCSRRCVISVCFICVFANAYWLRH